VYRHVGGLLEFTESHCCVVEDSDMTVCGYVVTCPDVGQYYKWFDETWLPSLKDKCPKLAATDSDSEVCLETCYPVFLKLVFELFVHAVLKITFHILAWSSSSGKLGS